MKQEFVTPKCEALLPGGIERVRKNIRLEQSDAPLKIVPPPER